MTESVAALCAGYGGLELGLQLAGVDHKLAWYAEIDDAAATVMAAHHPAAPNLGDLCDITDPEPVHTVTAGFPCQPVSSAGQREGIDDARWIIDDVCRVARLARARTLILENVAGIYTANDGDALSAVCAAMAREGFSRWEWRSLRAADVGAPHGRKRWFCIATSDTVRGGGRGPGRGVRPTGSGSVEPSADADGSGRPVERISGLRQDSDPLAGSDVDRRDSQRFGGYAQAVRRWETVAGRTAPDPTADGRLNPVFVEWMMGLPEGHVTGCGLKRTDQLRVLGNGVVPQQAAAAINLLKADYPREDEA